MSKGHKSRWLIYDQIAILQYVEVIAKIKLITLFSALQDMQHRFSYTMITLWSYFAAAVSWISMHTWKQYL